ncbi:MAG: flagellar biosynthesis protein FlgB [Acidimicrobiia bacterium]|nr:flagellar biosynthesis protein FlgB [Acidimicrobiia bacterium]
MKDLTIEAIHGALRGLAARQRLIAENIANVETPGFLAGRVSFEGRLRDAVRAGVPTAAEPAVTRSLAATNPNGNNVRLDDETVALVETQLRYQLMTEAISTKFRILRDSMSR